MYARHPQNTLHILELCKIHFLAPTAVKHTFFIDPGRIAVQISHMFTIIMFVFRHTTSTSFSSQLAPRFGSDVAKIFIPMNVSPLPDLDICHDHWTLAGQTIYLATSFYMPSSNYLLSQCVQAPLGFLAGNEVQKTYPTYPDLCARKYKNVSNVK